LTSVPAFAVDPQRGTFILALLAVYVGAALALFATRAATIREGAPFEPVSREGALVVNNLLLSVILGVVFVGTLYPIVAEALSGEKLSVGPPYFNAVAGPLALVLAALLFIGPLLRWRRDKRPLAKWVVPSALTAIAVLAVTLALTPAMTLLSRLGLGFGIALIPASIMPLFGRSLKRTPLATWGMVVAHLGVGVALIGMASDSAFTEEKLAVARPGDKLHVGPWLVELAGIAPVAGPNWTAIEAHLRASRGGGAETLRPQARVFTSPLTETTESAILTAWNGQLYAVVGRQSGDGWQLRLWWKPFVTLIWFGGALIALGGLIALVGRLWRARRRTVEADE
jgi:cytochrome c-type biogenesis protein CcmF